MGWSDAVSGCRLWILSAVAIIYGSWGAPFKRNIILERDTWYSFDRNRGHYLDDMNAICFVIQRCSCAGGCPNCCFCTIHRSHCMGFSSFNDHETATQSSPTPAASFSSYEVLCGVLQGWRRSILNRCFTYGYWRAWLCGSSRDRNGIHSHAMENLCYHTNSCVGVVYWSLYRPP